MANRFQQPKALNIFTPRTRGATAGNLMFGQNPCAHDTGAKSADSHRRDSLRKKKNGIILLEKNKTYNDGGYQLRVHLRGRVSELSAFGGRRSNWRNRFRLEFILYTIYTLEFILYILVIRPNKRTGRTTRGSDGSVFVFIFTYV